MLLILVVLISLTVRENRNIFILFNFKRIICYLVATMLTRNRAYLLWIGIRLAYLIWWWLLELLLLILLIIRRLLNLNLRELSRNLLREIEIYVDISRLVIHFHIVLRNIQRLIHSSLSSLVVIIRREIRENLCTWRVEIVSCLVNEFKWDAVFLREFIEIVIYFLLAGQHILEAMLKFLVDKWTFLYVNLSCTKEKAHHVGEFD